MQLVRRQPSSWTLLLQLTSPYHRLASLLSPGRRAGSHFPPPRAFSAPASPPNHALQLLHPQPVQTQVPAPCSGHWVPHETLFEAHQPPQHAFLGSVCLRPSTCGTRYSSYSLEARIGCPLYLSSHNFLMVRSWSSAEAIGAEALSKEDMKKSSEPSNESVLTEEAPKGLFSFERELDKPPLAEEAVALGDIGSTIKQGDSVTTSSIGVATDMEAANAKATQQSDSVTGSEPIEEDLNLVTGLPVNVGNSNKAKVHGGWDTEVRQGQEHILTGKLLRDTHARDEKRIFLEGVKVKDEISAVLEESLLEEGRARSSEFDAINESLNYVSLTNSLGGMLVSLNDKLYGSMKLLEANVKENVGNLSSTLTALIDDVGELKALTRLVANDVGALKVENEKISRLLEELLQSFSTVKTGPARLDGESTSISDFQREERLAFATESAKAGAGVAVAQEDQAVVNPAKPNVKEVSQNIGEVEATGMSQADIGTLEKRTDKTLRHEESAGKEKGNGVSRAAGSIGNEEGDVLQVSVKGGRGAEIKKALEGEAKKMPQSANKSEDVATRSPALSAKNDAVEHLEGGLSKIAMEDGREPLTAEASGPPSNIPLLEWSAFLEHLKKLDLFKDERPRGMSLSTFTDPSCVRRAAFKFSHSHENIFEFLPPKDLQTLAQYGCPSNDRRVVAAGKRLRGHFQIEEKNVCDLCSLQSSCQAAYVKPANVAPKLSDLTQLLLCIELQAAPQRGPLPVEVKTSVQNLLKKMVSLSMNHESGSPISQGTLTLRDIQEDPKKTVSEDRMGIQDEQKETVAGRKGLEADHRENRRNNADLQARKNAVKVGAGAESKISELKCPRCFNMHYAPWRKCIECGFERVANVFTDVNTMKTSVEGSDALGQSLNMAINGSKHDINDRQFTKDDSVKNNATDHQSTNDQGMTERSQLKCHVNGQQLTSDQSMGTKGLKQSVDVEQSIKDGNMDRGGSKNLDSKAEQDKSKQSSQKKAYSDESESDENEIGDFEDSFDSDEMGDEDDLPDYQRESPPKKEKLSSLLAMGSDDIPPRRGGRERDGEAFKSAAENGPRAGWKQRGGGYEARGNYSRGTTHNRFGKDDTRGRWDEDSQEDRRFRSRRWDDDDEERGGRRFRSARGNDGSGFNDRRGRSGEYGGGANRDNRELGRNGNRSGSYRDAGNKSKAFSEGRSSGRGEREERGFSPRSDSGRGRGRGRGRRR